ncbi:MAG: class I SAM-dependent methyltransferase [Deltaproteobacteria bacterium]|nr:class I SAM-dependent methyltransferase [Deltaproteobacteria bacterium]MBW2662077.1 class I SAM-dependent methyltransferase [Deltaproteobacteria bacterium]
MKSDYVSVTEIAGDEVTQEQIDRLCNRYYWAGQYCLDKDVVETACGSGQGLGYLAGIAKSLEAGDYSDEILSIVQRHYGERIASRQFDAQDMPFEDKSKNVIIMFEAIYYIPDAERFVCECKRVLRSGGKVLIATANKDLYDFNPSPHTYEYYGVVELNELFARHGFKTEFFGYMPVGDVSIRQGVLRPVKKLAVMLGIMPKTTAGKKWLKRIVFGGLVKMPVEIGPQITQTRLPLRGTSGQVDADLRVKKGPRITRNKIKEEDENDLYSGHYMEPDRISGREPDKMHKVIYCVASLG